MITENQFPQGLKADLMVSFKEGREAKANSEWRQLVMVEPTNSSAKTYAFYGDKGGIRRFRSERQPQTFYEYKFNLTLDEWESTRTVRSTVLADDQTGGLLKRKITNFGNEVETDLQKETEIFLHKGVSIACFDKAMFFSKSHVYMDSTGATHGNVQSNYVTGGSQLDATNLQVAQSMFANFLSDQNKPLGMRLTHVGVKRGSINEKTAKELSNSQYTVEVSTVKGQFTSNVFQGAFSIIPFDYALGASEWYAFDLSDSEMKPIIVLSHATDPGFDNMEFSQLLEDSDTGFWRREFAFGVYGRFDWNPGDWRTAILYGASDYTYTEPDLERQRVVYPNA